MNSLTQVLLDIARTANQEYGMSKPLTAVNTDQLIASAPDLLAALIAIRDFRDEENEWDAVEVCMPQMREIARAAIAEATETFDKSDELSDSERHEEREPSIDPQTGFES